MKKQSKFLVLISVSTIAFSLMGCGKDEEVKKAGPAVSMHKARLATPDSVTLYSREMKSEKAGIAEPTEDDDYRLSSFSFRYMTQDKEYARNNWDIHYKRLAIYETRSVEKVNYVYNYKKKAYDRYSWIEQETVRDGDEDIFGTQTVVDDFNNIIDLGETNCTDIKSEYEESKFTQPISWLNRSNVGDAMEKRSDKASIKEGHCYFVASNDSDGTVMAIFHVREHKYHESVTIDQIELLLDRRVER